MSIERNFNVAFVADMALRVGTEHDHFCAVEARQPIDGAVLAAPVFSA